MKQKQQYVWMILLIALLVRCGSSEPSPANIDIDATVNARVSVTQTAQAVSEISAPSPTTQPVETPIPPAPLDTGLVLWQDDFEQGVGESWSIVLGDWRVTNGYLVPTDEETNSIIVGGDPAWDDYTVQADIQQFSRSYYSGGILVRMQDPENFMRVRTFDSILSKGIYWEIVQNGESKIIPGTEVSRSMNHPPYQIKVVVTGNLYEVYVDGERQSSFTDNTFSNGYIGLQSFGYLGLPSNPHMAGFDNLLVTEN